ncbi:hypothetical protein NKW53_07710 [Acetobacter orientalis]|uniref:hypothetical protein n=1 Tax=Acetobacter orientalis TaxID=146474 RepID=UPI0020A07A4B|nr:hypothetical protein [Acetobacter orientalis]MCP1215945.1 hypothetical protein [Acetobacter orientalis]MCP1217895.1 hypothetical protein [Acetobacter orientalis]
MTNNASPSNISARTIQQRHESRIARAESDFIFDLMFIALDGEFIRPSIRKSLVDAIWSTMDGDVPDINKRLCGTSDKEFVLSDERDLNYEDEREILTLQEIKILRWSEARLEPSWKLIYITLVAMRIFIGAESKRIGTYRCIAYDKIIMPAIPVSMALRENLGVSRDDVPAWADIVCAMLRATGRSNPEKKMERLLVYALVSLLHADNTSKYFDDRCGEIIERMNGIVSTIPEKDLALWENARSIGARGAGNSGSSGSTVSAGGLNKKKAPALVHPAPRIKSRSPRPKWG